MTVAAQGQKMVVPDGGWGWFIVLGSSIINLSTRSIEPSFGLLFGDLLKELGVATTGASVIMSTLDALINFSGLFVGPLVKKFSFRKVGILGALLSCSALILTSYAESMTHIILTYSVLGGLGFGLASASTFVALNAYFSKRRGQAVGLAMAGTALGFMAMPQLISRLLEEYDFRGTVLILGALSLNAIVGASLLQPVKWHLKPSKTIPKIQEEPPPVLELHALPEENDNETECTHAHLHHDIEKEMSRSLLGLNIPRKPSVASGLHRQISVTSCAAMQNKLGAAVIIPRNTSGASITLRKRKTSTISAISNLDLMSSTMHVHFQFDESDDESEMGSKIVRKTKSSDLKNGSIIINKNEVIEDKKPTPGCWTKFSHLMDLDLLKDPIYLNILFGLSITYVAELNFKLVIPFFMANLNYTKRETAVALSVMAIADVCARVTVPPVLDRLEFSRRKTLMVGCVAVAAARSVLAEQTRWIPLLVTLVIHGFFRGMCLINFPLVISEYVPVDKFAAAYGLSMVSKGVFIVLLGPLPGYIRDITGSFPICIHTQSVMILMCVVAWSIESVMCWRRIQLENEGADLT